MFFLYCLFIYLLNEIVIRKKLYLDKVEFSKHKKFIGNNIKLPVTSGFYFLFFIILFWKSLTFIEYLLIGVIFLTGIFSDRFKNFSPLLRLISHIVIILFFIFYSNTLISDVRIEFINKYLELYYTSLIFTCFCFLILIHGTNFIDGVNLNTIGYYLIIYTSILFISFFENIVINQEFLNKMIFLLSFLLVLNIFNKTQLGDAGCYVIGFFTAFYLIIFVNNNYLVSPYFIILLLWYPCFENLFSILRKKYQNKKISYADNYHLHHVIYLFFKKRNIKNPNNISGLCIFSYNLLTLFLGSIFFNETKFLIFIIIFNIVFYIFAYNFLIKILKFKKFL